MKLRDFSGSRVRRGGSVPVVMSITKAYFAKTAHHPDLRVAPARGTRLVPKSCLLGVWSLGARSSASNSVSWSIPSTRIHDILKPTTHLHPCTLTTSLPQVVACRLGFEPKGVSFRDRFRARTYNA